MNISTQRFASESDLVAFVRATPGIQIVSIHPVPNGSGDWVLFYVA